MKPLYAPSLLPFGKLLLAALISGLLVSGCITQAQKPEATDIAKTEPQPTDMDKEPEKEEVKTNLQPEVLYDVLVGEVAGQRGRLDLAVGHLLRASQNAGNLGLTKRAVKVALVAHDYQAALEAAEHWLEFQPDNLEAMQTAAVLYIRTGSPERASHHLIDVINRTRKEQENQSTEAPFEQATAILGREKNKDAVMVVSNALLKAFPEDPYALFSHARLAFLADKPELTISSLKAALALKPEWPRATSLLARTLVDQGQVEEGLTASKTALDQDSDNIKLRDTYARLLLEAHKYDEAEAQFAEILDRDEDNSDALYASGLLAMDKEDYDAAETFFKRLLELKTRTHDAHYYLGNIAEQREDWAEAMRHYAAVKGGQMHFQARVREARMFAKRGHVNAAIAQIRVLRKRDQGRQGSQRGSHRGPQLYMLEAEILRDAGRETEAYEVYTQALKDYPDNGDLLYGRGLQAERIGDMAAMEADLRRAIELDPKDAHAMNALGYALTNHTDRYAEALELLEQAYTLEPNDHAITDSIGWVHYRLGNLGQARQFLRKALDLQPDAEVAAHLGEVLWEMGAKDEARQAWDEGKQVDADNPILKKTLERFQP